jgi:hypothetical protein
MLIAGFASSLTGLLAVRALVHPAAAEGRIHYSAMYGYRSGAAQTLGLALFTGMVALSFGSLAFMAGSLFLVAATIGYYWRTRQALRGTLPK